MDTPSPKVTDALRHDVEASWHRFLDLYEPLRPDLYRYCRHLTRSPWDADDLVQDALFRAFAKLGCMNEPPTNPRAWLFRVASNLWIDRMRAVHASTGLPRESVSSSEPRDVRVAVEAYRELPVLVVRGRGLEGDRGLGGGDVGHGDSGLDQRQFRKRYNA